MCACKYRYKIVIEFETSEPITESELEHVGSDAYTQLETLEEESGIDVRDSKFTAEPEDGVCTCRQFVNTGGRCVHTEE